MEKSGKYTGKWCLQYSFLSTILLGVAFKPDGTDRRSDNYPYCFVCGVLVLVASLLSLSLPIYWYFISSSVVACPRSGELRTQKLKSHLVRIQSLNVLPLKPEEGHIDIHATLTARDFLPCLFLHFRSIQLHFFPQNLSRFFLCCLWLTRCSCVDPQNKTGHPAGCRFPC